VPPETLFREITDYIFEALSSHDIHRLRRRIALQDKLLEATLERDQGERLLTVLGSLLQADIILISAEGAIESKSLGISVEPDLDALAARLWEAFRAAKKGGLPLSVIPLGQVVAHCREVSTAGVMRHVLVALRPANSLLSDFEGMALSFAQHLIELSLPADESVAAARRATRHRLLEQLLGEAAGRITEERLLAHGLSYLTPVRLMALSLTATAPQSPGHQDHPDPQGLLAEIERFLEFDGLHFLTLERRDLVLALLERRDDEDREQTLPGPTRTVLAVQPRVRPYEISCGVSCCGSLKADASRLLTQALLALTVAERDGQAVVDYGRLSVGHHIVGSLDSSVLRRLAEPLAKEPLGTDERHQKPLLPTLETFLEEGCSIGRTAEASYLHVNSVRKRLTKISSLLAIDLTTTDGIVEARLRLIAREVLHARSRFPSVADPEGATRLDG
jgi:hypothetical protein